MRAHLVFILTLLVYGSAVSAAPWNPITWVKSLWTSPDFSKANFESKKKTILSAGKGSKLAEDINAHGEAMNKIYGQQGREDFGNKRGAFNRCLRWENLRLMDINLAYAEGSKYHPGEKEKPADVSNVREVNGVKFLYRLGHLKCGAVEVSKTYDIAKKKIVWRDPVFLQKADRDPRLQGWWMKVSDLKVDADQAWSMAKKHEQDFAGAKAAAGLTFKTVSLSYDDKIAGFEVPKYLFADLKVDGKERNYIYKYGGKEKKGQHYGLEVAAKEWKRPVREVEAKA